MTLCSAAQVETPQARWALSTLCRHVLPLSISALSVRFSAPSFCLCGLDQRRPKRAPKVPLLVALLLLEATGSLRSPAALFMIAPHKNCGRCAGYPNWEGERT